MMRFASVKTANEIIKEAKENKTTNYFGQDYSSILPEYISFVDMRRTFRDKGFGEDEANVILACMVKAGCKFTV